ncbi:hypothetical protein [Solwaraspora sp. WMMD792]|uniref:hypothetical protein n=1 Tax=Solwaraspora sp. WMMD792 TaxID=3016099 RepID=UPI0024159CC1|nr:hypothetical protein [Solwaraspora sp. WMMD792]MDG4769535.1 hypothetical protein [Solwaraspora sp. WMMD792]
MITPAQRDGAVTVTAPIGVGIGVPGVVVPDAVVWDVVVPGIVVPGAGVPRAAGRPGLPRPTGRGPPDGRRTITTTATRGEADQLRPFFY